MEGFKATVAYKLLRNNLVALPASLASTLYNANISPQDVIIELVLGSKRLYAGWLGMNSGSSRSVDIDPLFAQSLQLADKLPVTVNMKIRNYEASNISLEPETPSDWELVELHAGILEDTLLTQSRCVSLNQVLVVYPSRTTSVRLLVTDIGLKEHTYAKISPHAEIAIAPKLRPKKSASVSGKSSKSAKSKAADDYSAHPAVLKRGISLPHALYEDLPLHSNRDGYEVYVNFSEVVHSLNRAEYAAVSIIAGPNAKRNSVGNGTAQNADQNDQKDKVSAPLKENKRIVARLVNCLNAPANTVGLSYKLAVALNVESQVGSKVVLKPAIKNVLKRPSTLIVHPYITQTKKTTQITVNSSEKKENDSKVSQHFSTLFFNDTSSISDSPISNFAKLPIIPHLLPHGGLLKFKRNDEQNAWIKPFLLEGGKKTLKIEVGEELLRNESFIEEIKQSSNEEEKVAIGVEKTIDDIIDNITTFKSSGTLVHGNSGSGKTLVLDLVSDRLNSEYGYHTKYVSCETVMNENYNLLSANHIFKWFQECLWHQPSLLVLDNLDKILSAEVEHVDSTNSKQLTEFFVSQLQKIHLQPKNNVSLLVSGVSKEALNGFLFQSHTVENFFHLTAPDKQARLQIIENYLVKRLGGKINFDIMDIVFETEGYLPNDLKILCDRIYHESLFNQSVLQDGSALEITKDQFEKSLKGYTPSNLRGVKLQKSSISWSDIGGLKDAKNVLLETLEWPTKYAPIFANCPLRLRSGILLYGYPGCGKTLLASAIAGQCGLNFISIKGPEILNKYIGASEQSVRELFERAQSAKPCILFFDEFDSIAPKRGHDSTGVTDRVVNQMLTQMDGAEGLDGVYVLAATSRPDLIDSALLRPGRLDKSVICDMPSYDDRLDILQSITLKMDLESDVNLEDIAEKTDGFSGADMQGLGYNAYLKAVHIKLSNDEARALEGAKSTSSSKKSYEFFEANSDKLKNGLLRPAERVKLLQQIEQIFSTEDSNSKDKDEDNEDDKEEDLKVRISQQNFVDSLKETKPSISVSEKKKLAGIYNKFVSGRDGNMPDGAASSEIGGRTTLM